MIGDALRRGGLEPRDVDVVAVSSGPGSYTGLRIGVSTAKGLASAVDADLVAVPSLEALAASVSGFASPGHRIAAAFDARREEVFAAVFVLTDDGTLRIVREAAAVHAADAAEWLGTDGDLWLVGEGWPKLLAGLQGHNLRFRHLDADLVRPSAASVARIASERVRRGRTEDLVTFEPYYLKEFVAAKPETTAFEKLTF